MPARPAGTLPQCPTVKLLVVYGLKSKGNDVVLLPPSPVPGVTIVTYEAVRPPAPRPQAGNSGAQRWELQGTAECV